MRDKFFGIFSKSKRKAREILQKRHIRKFDIRWKQIFYISVVWVLEALVEGLLANFATHYLFGVEFNLKMILAHGILIKQGLNIIERVRNKSEGIKDLIVEKEDKL